MGAERRRHTRYMVTWTGRLLLPNKSILPVKIKNVSKGGLMLEAEQAIGSGKEIGIEFSLPGSSEPMRVRAFVIVRFVGVLSDNRGAALGVEFSRVSREDMHTFSNMLQFLARDQEPEQEQQEQNQEPEGGAE